jgi:hypothetical protein
MIVLTKKEKQQIQEMKELEAILKIAESNTPEFTAAFKSWHWDYPDKLKNIRRSEMGVI